MTSAAMIARYSINHGMEEHICSQAYVEYILGCRGGTVNDPYYTTDGLGWIVCIMVNGKNHFDVMSTYCTCSCLSRDLSNLLLEEETGGRQYLMEKMPWRLSHESSKEIRKGKQLSTSTIPLLKLINIFFPKDLTPLINTEVPVHPPKSPGRQRRAVEQSRHSKENQQQRPHRAQCSPGFCLNGGLCVIVNGKANCRYVKLP